MFGRLKRGKPAHPMADAEHVQELIDLGSACAFAEHQDIAELRSQLHAEEPGPSSPREELLRALMLTTASSDNLAPLRPHLAGRIIAHLAGGLVLRVAPAADCAFAFDLALGQPPLRAGKTSARPNDAPYVLQPAGLMEGGEDFDCARFRVLHA